VTKQPDGVTERERGAWEINETQKRSALAAYDCAEQLFKAKADEQCLITQQFCNERVERLTDELRTERAMKQGCQDRLLSLAAGMKDLTDAPHEDGEDTVDYVLRIFERLTVHVRALVEEVKRCVCTENCADPHHVRRRALLARVGTEPSKRAEQERDWQTQEITALNNSLASANEDVVKLTARNAELVEALRKAKAEGRMEAFAEAWSDATRFAGALSAKSREAAR
jgi:hypothetical protein